MTTIRIACDAHDTLPLDDLAPLQGDLKSLSAHDFARLKRAIVETGFAFPVYVWRDKRGTNYIVGGHQRVRVLRELRDAEHYIIPPIPVIYVHAKNLTEARRRVLQDISQYGRIEHQGLYEFLSQADLSLPDLEDHFRLPEIDPKKFGDEFFSDPLEVVNDSTVEPEHRKITIHFRSLDAAAQFFSVTGLTDTGESDYWYPTTTQAR
jgi:hypothetical protein